MKTVLFVITVFCSQATLADKPIAEAFSAIGYGPLLQYHRHADCRLYKNKVVISRKFASLNTVEERPIVFTGDVNELLEKVKKEPLTETPNNFCGSGSLEVKVGELLLYDDGGCGYPEKKRSGDYTQIFKDLLATHCEMPELSKR